MDSDRSIWTGLTVTQRQQLAHDLRQPPRLHMPLTAAQDSLLTEYAARIAGMVAHNDLRGALWLADLWAHLEAENRGEKLRHLNGGYTTRTEWQRPTPGLPLDAGAPPLPTSRPKRRQATPARSA